jgi:hypothetical protein
VEHYADAKSEVIEGILARAASPSPREDYSAVNTPRGRKHLGVAPGGQSSPWDERQRTDRAAGAVGQLERRDDEERAGRRQGRQVG